MTGARYDFSGRTALVTGAAGGIGRSVATAFGAAGADVVVTDIQTAGGEETAALVEAAGGRAIFIPCDIGDGAEVDRLHARALDHFGRLDVACNNAAVELEEGPIADVSDDQARRIVDINFMGVFWCMRRQIETMLRQGGAGAIVNVASMNALRPRPDSAVYDGTKAAVLGMTRSAALAYTGRGIRVNAVCPGVTDTPMLAYKMGLVGVDRSMIEPVANLERRFGRPEEVAAAVLWLASDAASLVTGHAMPVEGGFLLTSAIPAA